MLQMIRDNFMTLFSYTGAHLLFALYVPAFVFLLFREKNRGKRFLFVYMPGALLLVVLLLPLRTVYERVLQETDTYYRLFWLIPFGMTVCYAAVTALEKYRYAMFALAAVSVMLGGSLVYNDAIITRAENRFHLSQVMLDVTNAVMEHREPAPDTPVGICMPPEFVQQVRQYDSRVFLPFGRGDVHWEYWHNAVLHAYEATVIDMASLDELLRAGGYYYLVLAQTKVLSAPAERYGWEEIALVHGYRIYVNPKYDYSRPENR